MKTPKRSRFQLLLLSAIGYIESEENPCDNIIKPTEEKYKRRGREYIKPDKLWFGNNEYIKN